MAISINQKANTTAPNSVYPFGDIKDDSGQNDGTPVNRSVYADFHQFFEKLMNAAGTVANGLPDNADNGFQLFEALQSFNNEASIANNGTFGIESEYGVYGSVDGGYGITSSEDFIYVALGSSGSSNVEVIQISKADGTVTNTLTAASDPIYNGKGIDVFYDATSSLS